MALYKLIKKSDNMGASELVASKSCAIEKECHVEEWVENHPFCLGLGELMIIHRQPSAKKEQSTLYPDLLAMDESGYLYVIELKKGRSPREIIAQSLEYASWLSMLDEEQFYSMAKEYLDAKNGPKTFAEHFKFKFDVDTIPELKSRIKTVLVAEDISSRVLEVTDYLQRQYRMDIYPVEIKLYATEDNGHFVETKLIGSEVVQESNPISSERWSENKSATEIVYEAVREFTEERKDKVFGHSDIAKLILAKYPNFNPGTIRCNIYANCVDHPSRIHYNGKHEYYSCAGKGKFTLYNSQDGFRKVG